METEFAKNRREAVVTFIQEFNLNKEYAHSQYKTPYGFIKYNYKNKFYNWVITTKFKDLFISDKWRER